MTRHLCLAVALFISLLGVPPARGDDFTEFRIPAHKTFNWTGSLNAGGRWSAGHDGGNSNDWSDLGTGFGTDAQWFSDSDPVQSYLSLAGSMSGSRSLRTNEDHFGDPLVSRSDRLSEDRDRGLGESWSVSVSHRRYPGSGPWGFSIDGLSAGNYSQSWSNRDAMTTQVGPGFSSSQISRQNSQAWGYSYFVSASAMVGYGRLRDATPVFEARTFEDRMLASGALTRPLSTEARRRLTALLASNGDYGTTRDRPARHVWEEIERILREDGALSERGLDPYSVLRATEPLHGRTFSNTRDGIPVSPIRRSVGSFVGPIGVVQHVHQIRREDEDLYSETVFNGFSNVFTARNSSRFVQNFDRVLAGMSGQLGRPIGMRWQLDADGRVLLPVRKEERGIDAGAAVGMSYIATERWLGSVKVQANWHDDDRFAGRTRADRWIWVYGATASRYIQDRTLLKLEISERQDWVAGENGTPSSFGPRRYRRDGQVSLALTHRFAGMFDSNGLFPALAPGGLGRP